MNKVAAKTMKTSKPVAQVRKPFFSKPAKVEEKKPEAVKPAKADKKPELSISAEEKSAIDERPVDPKLLDQLIKQAECVVEHADIYEDLVPAANALMSAAGAMKANMTARSERLRIDAENRVATENKAKARAAAAEEPDKKERCRT